MTYPAATWRSPGWRQSASVPGVPGGDTRLWIEKIVPIETLTLMFDEPSSGSKRRT